MCPQVGLAALKDGYNTVVAWKEGPGWNALVQEWIISFYHGSLPSLTMASLGPRECLDPGNLGSKKLQGKES